MASCPSNSRAEKIDQISRGQDKQDDHGDAHLGHALRALFTNAEQARTPEEQTAQQRYQAMDAAYNNANPTTQGGAGATAAAAPTAPGAHRPSCRKHFRIDGTDQILSLARHFQEFTSDELDGHASGGRYIKGWKEQWASKYERGGYQEVQGTHTKKQDCAGYVMISSGRRGKRLSQQDTSMTKSS